MPGNDNRRYMGITSSGDGAFQYNGDTTNNYYGTPPPGNSPYAPPVLPAPAAQAPAVAPPPGQRSVRDYTVGWICALPYPEWQASRMLYDEEHDDLPLTTTYQYVYGKMGVHNVVMGCAPDGQMGKSKAAAVAAEMSHVFPALRFGLLVGVAGGVPSANNDIRLGDVVVSRPDKDQRHGGVVQYDYGKFIQGGGFRTMGSLNSPPTVLLSALGKVKSAFKGSQFDTYLQSYAQWDDFPQYLKPQSADRLFESDCLHEASQPTCARCDPTREVQRSERRTPKPRVFYGTIASGDGVMKDAFKRDEINRANEEVLCFEMEAAGLVDHFPCLVIRGICDYCDSHKHKEWQPYAAAAAASWAKELLRNITSANVEGSTPLG